MFIKLCIGKCWLRRRRSGACLGSGTWSVRGWGSGDAILTHLMLLLLKRALLTI